MDNAEKEMTKEELIRPGERADDLQYKSLVLIQKENTFRFGTDAVLLTNFAAEAVVNSGKYRKRLYPAGKTAERAAKPVNFLDIGCGSGIIPVERLRKSSFGRVVCRVYTLLAVCLLFVLFRADHVGQGLDMIGSMFSFRTAPEASVLLAKLLDPACVVTLLLALVLAGKAGIRVHAFLTEEAEHTPLPALCCLLLLVLSVLSLAQSGFHPFIYFQF